MVRHKGLLPPRDQRKLWDQRPKQKHQSQHGDPSAVFRLMHLEHQERNEEYEGGS